MLAGYLEQWQLGSFTTGGMAARWLSGWRSGWHGRIHDNFRFFDYIVPMKARLLIPICLLVLSGCATSGGKPPSNSADACSILDEKRGWENHVFDAARKWDVAPGIILAFMRQESGFRQDARPIDRQGNRLSSAYGYSQALDGTWAQYERAQGGGKRKSFEDSADFIGWYLDLISKQAGIAKTDARNLYLAYHEGPAGFRRGSHSGKAWLLPVATRVASQATAYNGQLRGCEARQMRRFASN
jgi:hypothetical protein